MSKSRKTDNALKGRMGQARNPIYLLDQGRTIRYCNDSLAKWVAVEAADLVGRRCDYHSIESPDVDALSAGLCPRPSAFSGERSAGIVATKSGTGSIRRRTADFIPLTQAADTDVLVVVATQDLSPGEVDEMLSGEGTSVDPLHEQIRDLRVQLNYRFRLDQLIGVSDAMRRVRDQIHLAGHAVIRTVVIGPAGSGRERVARTIDAVQFPQVSSPLIPLDCSLLDAELIQTTIEALLRRTAELEEEDLSKLLLLEIDQLPVDAQAALAGFVHVEAFNLHALSTARRSLVELAEEGKFRTDLAYMLSTLEIRIPALVDRPEDIPLLAQAAIEHLNARGAGQIQGLTRAASEMLLDHSWLGNVDELFSVLAQAHQASDGLLIDDRDLPRQLWLAADAEKHPSRPQEAIELDQYLREIESELIRRALEASSGNRAQAARLLGISRSRLLRRLEALEVNE